MKRKFVNRTRYVLTFLIILMLSLTVCADASTIRSLDGGVSEEDHGIKPLLHGTATASIAVGKTVGVAPEADLYFLQHGENPDKYELGIYIH